MWAILMLNKRLTLYCHHRNDSAFRRVAVWAILMPWSMPLCHLQNDSAFRWAESWAISMLSHETVCIQHSLWRERSAVADSNRRPAAYTDNHNALPASPNRLTGGGGGGGGWGGETGAVYRAFKKYMFQPPTPTPTLNHNTYSSLTPTGLSTVLPLKKKSKNLWLDCCCFYSVTYELRVSGPCHRSFHLLLLKRQTLWGLKCAQHS